MKLSQETKQKIGEILNSEEFLVNLYKGLTEEKREELGQVYTPAELCIQMIERFKCDTLSGRNILDPTAGSGNLLIACLIAGADPDKLYGNEYDSVAVELCRTRLNRACEILDKPLINDWQVHQGNALIEDCLTDFGPEYDETILVALLEEHSESNKKGAPKFTWLERPELYVRPEPKSNKPKKSISDIF